MCVQYTAGDQYIGGGGGGGGRGRDIQSTLESICSTLRGGGEGYPEYTGVYLKYIEGVQYTEGLS